MLIQAPLDQLDDNPFQRRQDYGDVEALAADISARGLLQIPRGRIVFTGGGAPVDARHYQLAMDDLISGHPDVRIQLAFGHRRLRAYRHLAETIGGNWRAMPVYVEALTDDQMLDAVWSENQHRSDINPIEQAELLAEKLDRARAAGGNQTTVATEWGLDRSTIANKLRLLDLPADVQTAVRERRLSERQATALLSVAELETKLNGTAVTWDARINPWNPVAPTTYIAHVLANPDDATSDKIRDYVQQAARHAGRPLGDAFAAFEAGDGRAIVQSACKGCPKRHNQTCLHRPCYDARLERYQAAIPEWATRETGLPFSSDDGDFDVEYHTAKEIVALYHSGHHDDLVVGLRPNYYHARPYPVTGPSNNSLLQDWRHSLIIGRATHATTEDADSGEATTPRPTAAELKLWTKSQGKADRERAKRTKAALREWAVGLLHDETGLRVLSAMLHGYELRQYRERGETPTAEQLLDLLFEKGWRAADTTGHQYNLDQSNRTSLRQLLDDAAMPADIVDPPDPALRLLDIGQLALITYDATRQNVGTGEAYKRIRRLRDALAEFDAAPAVVAANDELTTLATYLSAAIAREKQRLATEVA